MALINPKTGSSRFKAVVRHEAVISLAGEEPVIIEQAEEFGLKLLADATNGEELSHKDLQEVPDEEIGEDGFWIHSQAAKLKNMTQEELIAMVLQLQGNQAPTPKQAPVEEDAPAEEEAEDTAEEPAENVEEETPAPKKRKKKRPAPKKDEEAEEDEETEEVAF